VITADLARFEASPLASDVSNGKFQKQIAGSTGSSSKYTFENAESDAAAVASDVVDATLDDAAVTLQGHVGEPVEEILAEAERRAARYLVLGGRKRTQVGKALFESLTRSVLLGADFQC
jgi:nucleotide-binding universal stress UspA family protein